MEIIYKPDSEFAVFVQSQGIGKAANLIVVDGKMRWKITREDGTEYLCLPESTRK